MRLSQLHLLFLVSILLHCFSEEATTERKRRPRPVTDTPKNVTQPKLESVIKTKSNTSHTNSKPEQAAACVESTRVCHKVSQRINLGDVVPGSRLVIISPKFAQVGLCVGSCSYSKHGSLAYKRNLRSLFLARRIASVSRRRGDVGGCVPTRLGSIDAEIFVDGMVVPYVLHNMTVEECGCLL
ncbi:uncharacterized protein LOC134192315 [Corticium candelabrum]|uniref:uncharacterized protein LOC134192315 n=1 Tax=Corticium candelabrum TaxID=121492 RepID=UPI002E26D8E1|nr:uncharacterized protein LOC134192315 [Corticium candelabrum]